jgi:hypothetical protein
MLPQHIELPVQRGGIVISAWEPRICPARLVKARMWLSRKICE